MRGGVFYRAVVSLTPLLEEKEMVASERKTPAKTSERLSVQEKIGYGLGDMASNLFWKMFEFFLLYFYTDVFGISAKATGTMLLVTRVWDAVNDPLVGYLADRTRTTWGRFRPYLIWTAIPFAITGILTFSTPSLSPQGKLVYAYVTYTLVMMAYTVINIPYGALMGVITSSSLERTSVSTYRFVCAFLGGVIVQYCTLDLVRFFGGGPTTVIMSGGPGDAVVDEQVGFFWTMVVYSAAAVLLFVLTFLSTKERVQPADSGPSTYRADYYFLLTNTRFHQILLLGLTFLSLLASGFSTTAAPWILVAYMILSLAAYGIRIQVIHRTPEPPREASSLQHDFEDLLGNGPWLVLFGYGLLQLTAAFLRGGVILYYFKYFCHREDVVSAFFVSGSLAAIAGMLASKILVRWFGKKQLMVGLNVVVALLTAGFFFLRPEDVSLMFGLHILASLAGGPTPVLLWAMYADTADYSEWKNNRRATGLIFAAATFSQKLGCAVGSAMTGFALDFFEYVAPLEGIEQPQSETTLRGLVLMMSLIPAAFFLMSAICLAFYGINEQTLSTIESDLARKRCEGDPPS